MAGQAGATIEITPAMMDAGRVLARWIESRCLGDDGYPEFIRPDQREIEAIVHLLFSYAHWTIPLNQ